MSIPGSFAVRVTQVLDGTVAHDPGQSWHRVERTRIGALRAEEPVLKAFQDYYPERFSHCYGCGRSNPAGLHLKSYWDGDETVARFTVPAQYSGGVPGHAYGGMVASLLDCHGTASAAAFAYRAAGRSMADEADFMRFVTASLKVDYLRPTPVGEELVIKGRLLGIDGRKVRVALALVAAGDNCAAGEMLAIRLGS
jgi:acyl-coenzyme A thioesterase PaaI-like protein